MIPSYPLIQHAVMLGFVYEVIAFTIGFAWWHRKIDRSRKILQIELDLEKKVKILEIQSAEQRIKDRVARDLHDDIAASISGIRILGQVARSQFGDRAPDAKPLLEQINESAKNALESISDLIWAVKPHPDYLNDMADRMRNHAAQMLDAKDIEYSINIPRDLPFFELGVEVRRNMYLIFKEALNNALKYSLCTQVEIEMFVRDGRLVLRVADNGQGFEPGARTSDSNGMLNMERRALELGGAFSLRAAPGEGTSVEVSLILS
jgi:signal transduction histidine kinase